MFFQLIAEVLVIILLLEVLCRMITRRGLWASVKDLFTPDVRDAVTDVIEHPHVDLPEDRRLADLRREVMQAEEEVRLAQQEGDLAEALAEKKQRLAVARGRLTKAARAMQDSEPKDAGGSAYPQS